VILSGLLIHLKSFTPSTNGSSGSFSPPIFDQITIGRVYDWDTHQQRIQQAGA